MYTEMIVPIFEILIMMSSLFYSVDAGIIRHIGIDIALLSMEIPHEYRM
jgi:hypothetical protein